MADIHTNTCEIIRPVTASDISLLSVPEPSKPEPLKKIREAHHKLAAMIACGATGRDIQEATGYSYSRISILKADPTFQQLVSHYEGVRDAALVAEVQDYASKLLTGAHLALDLMIETMRDNPDSLSPDTKKDYAEFFADRTGFGKQTKSLNASVNLNSYAEQIAEGRRRAAQLSAGPAPAKPAQLDPPKPAGRAGVEDA